MGVGGQCHTLVTLPSGKIPGTSYTGGFVFPKDGLDRYEKLAPTGIRPRTVQPAASCCIDCSIPSNTYDSEQIYVISGKTTEKVAKQTRAGLQ
jgi:hypothetical protein